MGKTSLLAKFDMLKRRLLVKIAYNFGGKIQMGLKSVQKNDFLKKFPFSTYLISWRLEDSLIVGRVALNLSVGLKWRKVRFESFQTNLCRWATVHSLLYLSNWLTTMPRQLTKLPDGICKKRGNLYVKSK